MEQAVRVDGGVVEPGGHGGGQGGRVVGLGRRDADQWGQPVACGGAQHLCGPATGPAVAVEAGTSLGGLRGADGGGQPLGDDGAEAAGAPQGREGGGDEQLQDGPVPAVGDQVEEALLSAAEGGGVGE